MGKKLLSFLMSLALLLPLLPALGVSARAADFPGDGDGSADHPYLITTAAQLDAVRNDPAAHYILENDIDLTDACQSGGAYYNGGAGWAPIGGKDDTNSTASVTDDRFTGDFNGNGYTISGLAVDDTATGGCDGLFSCVGTGGTVENLLLVNASVSGHDTVGCLAGYNGGTIASCGVQGSSSVTGQYTLGGLVGNNGGVITSCYALCTVTGSTSNSPNIGGLVGYNSGSSAAVRCCYAVGPVTGASASTGGLVGTLNSGTVADSYYSSTVSGMTDTGKGTGLTTLQMLRQTNFTDFSFTGGSPVWAISEGVTYPYLTAFASNTAAAKPAPAPSITVGNQSGTLMANNAVSLTVTVIGAQDDAAVTGGWCDAGGNAVSAPTGLTIGACPDLSGNLSTVTVTATAAEAGTYYLKVSCNGITSAPTAVRVGAFVPAWGGSPTYSAGETVDISTLNTDAQNTILTFNGGTEMLVGASGKTYTNLTVALKGGAAVTFQNVNISGGRPGFSPVEVQDGGANMLLLSGTNTLTGGLYHAGIHLPSGMALTIGKAAASDADAADILTATGGHHGAGIGGSTGVIIDPEYGTVAGSNAGSLTVTGGTVNANGGKNAAGIGGGCGKGVGQGSDGAGGSVTITGGIVTATGINSEETYNGAHAGSGAGIGGGWTGYGGSVSISGGSVSASSTFGAGIGGGAQCSSVRVTISGGTVTAGSVLGAGIGSGQNDNNKNSSVTVTGGSISPTSMSAYPTSNGSTSVYLTTATLKNRNGTAVPFASVTALTVTGLTAYSYGVKGMNTDASGKLYLYLPSIPCGNGETVNVTGATAAAGGTSRTYIPFPRIPAGTSNSLFPAPAVTSAYISITSTGSGTGGAYIVGDTVTAAWDNSTTGDNNAGIGGVTMDFSQFGGGSSVAATANGDLWTASCTIASGNIDTTGAKVTVTAYSDASTGGSGNTGSAASSGVTVDTIAPAPVSAAWTDNTHITVTLSESCKNLAQTGTGGFTVCDAAASTETYPVSAIAPGADTSHVILTVANLAASGQNGVTVAYAPGTITDAAGNAVPTSSKSIAAWDTVPPTTSCVTVTDTTLTSALLKWSAASDAGSDPSALRYLVYESSGDNLTSVADIEANGTALGSYAANITSKQLTGLTANTTYYYNVIVMDEAGNKACYTSRSVTTTVPLDSIPAPAAITGLANRTAKTAAALSLPSTVTLNTDGGDVSACVTWDVAGCTYDAGSAGAQTFTVSGTVTLPTGVVNPTHVNLTIDISVSVLAATSSGGGSSTVSSVASTVTGSDGSSATLTVTTSGTSSTAALGSSQNSLLTGGVTLTLAMPAVSGTTSYGVQVPAGGLSSSAGGALVLKTALGNITLPSDMLSNTSGASGETAQVTISRVDTSSLPTAVSAQIGDRPVIRLSLSLGGTQADWSNPDAPVTVRIPYTPTAAELKNPNGIVVWYIDGSGSAVCVPNGHYDAATGTVTFSTTHFSDYAVAYNAVSFSDVAAAAWYHDAVAFIAARGITSGTTATTFSPDASLTRGQFVTLLLKAYGISPDAASASNFSDAGSTYYTGYLAAAKRLGISNGVGGNLFAPDRAITRQEMFTMLYNALKALNKLPSGTSGKALSDFTDGGSVAAYAREAMGYLVKTGTVSGSRGLLEPTATTTRAEFTQVLYHLMAK